MPEARDIAGWFVATQGTPGLIIVIAIVVAVGMLLTVVQLVRGAWRIFRDNEEMEPGGSWGRQLSSRTEGTHRRRMTWVGWAAAWQRFSRKRRAS